MKKSLPALLLAGLAFGGSAWAQTSSNNTAPDDTKMNKKETVTAEQQSNKQSDVDIAAKIRRQVVSNNKFSQYAKNVKVVVKGGKVTLTGPVRDAQEKAQIQEIAEKVAGSGKVTNDIEIAPAH